MNENKSVPFFPAPNGMKIYTDYLGLDTTVTRVSSDGQPVQATTYTQDSQGQIIQVQDGLKHRSSYVYGPFGVLTSVTGPDGSVFGFEYDVFGNKTVQTDPDMGKWLYRYNAFGELKWQKDANAQLITFEYDDLGRNSTRTEGSGTGAVTTRWAYDSTVMGKGLGRLDKVTHTANGGTTESYLYDGAGRVNSMTSTIDGVNYVVATGYDAFDRTDTVAYPGSGLTVKYGYYSNNALHTVSDANNAAATFWQADSYNALGQVKTESWQNGVTGTREYGALTGRLKSIKAGPNASIQNLSYLYYQNGNLNSRTDGKAGVTEDFQYDVLDRLTRVKASNPTTPRTYRYDAGGNIIAKTGLGVVTYGQGGAGPHAVSSVSSSWTEFTPQNVTDTIASILGQGSVGVECDTYPAINIRDVLCMNNYIQNATSNGVDQTYSYDANGNLTDVKAGVTTLRNVVYTAFNKPSSITAKGATTSYTYGSDWQRQTKKTGTGVTTTYVGKLYERDSTATGVTEERYYITAAGRLVTQVKKTGTATPVTESIHTDLLGSVVAVTNNAGAIVAGAASNFDEYGQPDSAATVKRGYTGHEMDAETGLINMNARLYDPLLGRFMTPDPTIPNVYNPQSLNRYSYVLNNPFRYTDPTGYAFESLYFGVKFDSDTGIFFGGGAYSFPDGTTVNSAGDWRKGYEVLPNTTDYSGVGEDFFADVKPISQTFGTVYSFGFDVAEFAYDAAKDTVNILLWAGAGYASTESGVGIDPIQLPEAKYINKEAAAFADPAIAVFGMLRGQPPKGFLDDAGRAIGDFIGENVAKKGLTTPKKYFGNKTKPEVKKALENKYGSPKSSRKNADTYYNPKSKRSFNVHEESGHNAGKPHVDIRRRGGYPERKYDLKDK